jgi:hypothetical protein
MNTGSTLTVAGSGEFADELVAKSTMSVTARTVLGGALSVADTLATSGNLSVLGSLAQLKGALSVEGWTSLTGDLSVTGVANFGTSDLSASGMVSFGSLLSVRSSLFAGSNLSVNGEAFISAGSLSLRSYIKLDSFALYAGDVRRISAGTSGEGVLHGTWRSDTWISSSDVRLKTDIRPLDEEISLEKSVRATLRELRPVAFAMKDDEHKRRRYGFIAQEIQRILPDIVHTDEVTDMKAVLYTDLIAVLVQAVHEQDDLLENLRQEIDDLRHQLDAFRQSDKEDSSPSLGRRQEDALQQALQLLERQSELINQYQRQLGEESTDAALAEA